jgi:hypothetical protein
MPPGVLWIAGMGLQLPPGGIVVSIGDDGLPHTEVKTPLVRLDLWATWLEIGCAHAAGAAELADQLRSETLGDEPKGNFLSQELQQAIVAVTAFAFAFDGFYDVVRHELGQHPDAGIWRTNRTARHKQITETLRYHLKLGPKFTAHLGSFVEELLNFRGRAVHPSSRFVEAGWRPDIDCGVHPHFITFSGPNAVQARALALTLLDRLLDRARELTKPDSETGWLDTGRTVLDRLSRIYRIAGDDVLAFAEDIALHQAPT